MKQVKCCWPSDTCIWQLARFTGFSNEHIPEDYGARSMSLHIIRSCWLRALSTDQYSLDATVGLQKTCIMWSLDHVCVDVDVGISALKRYRWKWLHMRISHICLQSWNMWRVRKTSMVCQPATAAASLKWGCRCWWRGRILTASANGGHT